MSFFREHVGKEPISNKTGKGKKQSAFLKLAFLHFLKIQNIEGMHEWPSNIFLLKKVAEKNLQKPNLSGSFNFMKTVDKQV